MKFSRRFYHSGNGYVPIQARSHSEEFIPVELGDIEREEEEQERRGAIRLVAGKAAIEARVRYSSDWSEEERYRNLLKKGLTSRQARLASAERYACRRWFQERKKAFFRGYREISGQEG